jgi:hypothetical protein
MARWLAGILVGLAITILAAGAHATADPWANPAPPGSPPAGAPPAPPPSPGAYPPGPPPAPYGSAPAPYAPLTPYPAYPAYGTPAPPNLFLYDSQKKNEMVALVIEFFIPGVGSIYADHVAGALITWAALVGGISLIVWWAGRRLERDRAYVLDPPLNSDPNSGSQDVWAVYLGLGLIVGGRIYGLVDSYSSTKDYNRRLRARLGLPEWGGVTLIPIRTDRAVAWGPALAFRF